ncbi:fimbria/pilus outer membrane usher protein, partial [Enterococcus faecium]|uniref:fimbria/pilus outer membrane usher protein n=1 Tax=Enterococcus faecium TaxID=1352 RepID=UPI0039FD66A7
GGVVIHPHGVTLSQYLGNAFALIDANGASGVRIQNYPGIATDPFGYWICPYISRHLLSLNPLLACCRRYSRGER